MNEYPSYYYQPSCNSYYNYDTNFYGYTLYDSFQWYSNANNYSLSRPIDSSTYNYNPYQSYSSYDQSLPSSSSSNHSLDMSSYSTPDNSKKRQLTTDGDDDESKPVKKKLKRFGKIKILRNDNV